MNLSNVVFFLRTAIPRQLLYMLVAIGSFCLDMIFFPLHIIPLAERAYHCQSLTPREPIAHELERGTPVTPESDEEEAGGVNTYRSIANRLEYVRIRHVVCPG